MLSNNLWIQINQYKTFKNWTLVAKKKRCLIEKICRVNISWYFYSIVSNKHRNSFTTIYIEPISIDIKIIVIVKLNEWKHLLKKSTKNLIFLVQNSLYRAYNRPVIVLPSPMLVTSLTSFTNFFVCIEKLLVSLLQANDNLQA